MQSPSGQKNIHYIRTSQGGVRINVQTIYDASQDQHNKFHNFFLIFFFQSETVLFGKNYINMSI